MVIFNSIKKARFVSSLIKTALHNLNKQRPKEFPMQKMLEALFNKFIYLPSEGKLWWVFTELQLICHLIYLLILTGYFILTS